ncbi:Lrp/AsnC family transcriptional regulator [Flindersiella endophytica]
MESLTLDDTDRGLLHALQIDGRAAFSRIAEALSVSESTIARRYQRLRADGVVRVLGSAVGAPAGASTWTLRLRCTPDAAEAIAEALARRPDTYWIHLLSGGTELSCMTQAPPLLEKLPRTARILDLSAHLLLNGFTDPGGWAGLAHLTPEQAGHVRPRLGTADPSAIVLGEADHAVLGALARDGRASYRDLAAEAGWSESTVKRRMALLRAAGMLRFHLDLDPRALGYRTEARLWISVQPSALEATGRALSSHPEIYFAAATTGATNVLAAVVCRSPEELYRYLAVRVAGLPGVNAVEAAPILRTVKRFGPGPARSPR